MWLKSAQHLSKNPSILYYTILPGQVVLFNQSALQYELLTVTEYFLLCYFSRDSLPQYLKQSELTFQSPACKESPKQTDKSTKKSKGKLKKRSNINHESKLMQKGSTWALWKSDVVIDRDKYEGCGQKWRVCPQQKESKPRGKGTVMGKRRKESWEVGSKGAATELRQKARMRQ